MQYGIKMAGKNIHGSIIIVDSRVGDREKYRGGKCM
jgi:hypothetical protein